MKASMNSTLAATLIATAVGVGAWFFGVAKVIWPAHPQLAAFLLTLAASIVVKQIWPAGDGQKENLTLAQLKQPQLTFPRFTSAGWTRAHAFSSLGLECETKLESHPRVPSAACAGTPTRAWREK